MRRALIAAGVAAALALGATAHAAPCADDAGVRAERLRARLDRERHKAFRWRVGWAVGFGLATAAQAGLVLAETNPVGVYDDGSQASLKVGAVKSFVGLAARLVTPVKVPRPAVSGDACADLAAAQAALAKAARSERQSFWLNHLGGLALQVAGTLYIGMSADDAWDDAAISFGLGYAIGLASTYTQPRGAWHEHRGGEETWQVAPLVTPQIRGLAVGGTF